LIPKVVHYCWFGRGEKPQQAKKCIESWRRFLPDYDVIEWNEDNFDVNTNCFVKGAYEQKKYAFVSDYARLYIIYNYGGIYMDTDVEVIKNLDGFLNCEGFIGFENNDIVNTGMILAAAKENPVVLDMMNMYESEEVLKEDGSISFITCPILNTKPLEKRGLIKNGFYQELDGMTVYPVDYFGPFDNNTGKLSKTKNTMTIHWYSKSWIDPKTRMISKVTRIFHRLFGVNCFNWLKKLLGRETL